jgi:hypothetical protein
LRALRDPEGGFPVSIHLNGQWSGRYQGTNTGLLVVNLDDQGSYYEGHAFAFDDNPMLTPTIGYIRTLDKSPAQTLTVPLQTLSSTGEVLSAEQANALYPTIQTPNSASVIMALQDSVLHVSATMNIPTQISAELPRTRAGDPSEYVPLADIRSWKQFKEEVVKMSLDRLIFRGQDTRHRLRTSYHRTGRAAFGLYLNNDIRDLHLRLSARTRHIFNIDIPAELGSFVSLAQHHGYPTPLLDWTYSPFIAAFFAYRRIKREAVLNAGPDDRVRLFIFDHVGWAEKQQPVLSLAPHTPHISILKSLPIDNERVIPQQSVTTVTNVDDIEGHIQEAEAAINGEYLWVVDLPIGERPLVMRELATMGITAGAMFPSLDGTCEEQKERLFPVRL